jgi:hypothetical protein
VSLCDFHEKGTYCNRECPSCDRRMKRSQVGARHRHDREIDRVRRYNKGICY